MEQEEYRVRGGGVEIRHVAADGPVAAAVDAERVSGAETLHHPLEVFEVDALEDEIGGVCKGVVACGEEGVEVALQAARVVLVV